MQASQLRPSFAASFAVQRRVIHALLMREIITRFGRRNLGVLWLVAEPMLFTLGVTALWAAAGFGHSSQMPIAAFAITGYSSVLMWRNSVGRCTHAIHQNMSLLFHRNVQVIDVLATRIILEVIGASGSFIILILIFMSLEMISGPVDLLQVLIGWAMLTWFGSSLGLLMGALSSYSTLVERLWHPMAYLLFPLSGAGFMVDWLPPAAREVILWLPMVHGTEMLREGYFGNVVRTYYDLSYMAAVNAGLSLLGLFLVRDAGRRVEAE